MLATLMEYVNKQTSSYDEKSYDMDSHPNFSENVHRLHRCPHPEIRETKFPRLTCLWSVFLLICLLRIFWKPKSVFGINRARFSQFSCFWVFHIFVDHAQVWFCNRNLKCCSFHGETLNTQHKWRATDIFFPRSFPFGVTLLWSLRTCTVVNIVSHSCQRNSTSSASSRTLILGTVNYSGN